MCSVVLSSHFHTAMEHIKANDKIVVIGSDQQAAEELRIKYSQCSDIDITSLQNISNNEHYDVGIIIADECINELSKIIKILKPNATFIVHPSETCKNLEFALKTNGFVNVSLVESGVYVCKKPVYKVGSTVQLNFGKAAPVWTLDSNDDDIIDQDNLLDDDDLKKPTIASLRVCGTTGKRKACKDCSCGLADELNQESNKNGDATVTNAPKSSCGSCYLGDAFRCASCPYLGMPAFKPGEKIQLQGNQLEDDL